MHAGSDTASGYRCEAATVAGFIQQLAVAYVAKGYWFYVTGKIPSNKSPEAVDQKIIERYGIRISKWARVRRRRRGAASVQYLRRGHFFILLATHGEHVFFEAEKRMLCDVRRIPIKFGGYSIAYREKGDAGNAIVRIERRCCLALRSFFLNIACEDFETISAEFRALSFEPYAAVRRQLLGILGKVNQRRAKAGLEPIPREVVRLRRKSVRCFVQEIGAEK